MTRSDLMYDVAIIGYGPTGQMLSLLLGEKGYRSRFLNAGRICTHSRVPSTTTTKSPAFSRRQALGRLWLQSLNPVVSTNGGMPKGRYC